MFLVFFLKVRLKAITAGLSEVHWVFIFNLSDVIPAAKYVSVTFLGRATLFSCGPIHISQSPTFPFFFDGKLNEISLSFIIVQCCSHGYVGAHLDGRQVSGLQDGEHLSSVHREGTETLTPVANYRFSFLLLLRVHKFCLQVYICSLHSLIKHFFSHFFPHFFFVLFCFICRV